MKKAAIRTSLAVMALAPVLLSFEASAYAQAGSGQIVMEPAEQADYDNAMNKITVPAQQAPALEAYLAKYPKSGVKDYVLQKIMIDYYQAGDPAKTLTAADNYLQVKPTDLQTIVIEVALRKDAAEKQTDPAAKQSGLDAAASFAQKGLDAAKSSPPAGADPAQFANLKNFATPTFYGVMGEDALNKNDGAAAVTAYTAEIASLPPFKVDDLNSTNPQVKAGALSNLQETFFLGRAYLAMTPPDYVNCTFYTTRAAALAPDQYKPSLQPTATFCYKKFHGTTDGYDAVVASAKANATMPADLKITPAPTDADQVNKLMSDTAEADLPKLALSDKEYIMQYGTKEQGDKVFDTIKGKSVEIPDATVISATDTQITVAVSDESVSTKTADFTFNLKAPLKTTPAAGAKISLTGTYTSYTQKPVMITMDNGEELGKKAPVKAPVKKAPVRRTH